MAIAPAAGVIAWVILVSRRGAPASVRLHVGSAVLRVDAAAMALAVIAVLCLVLGAGTELNTYTNAVATRSLVTPADVTVLKTLNAKYPSTTIVMTNSGNDAGMWLAGLTDLTPMVPNGFEYGTLSVPLNVSVSDACTDPADAEEAITYEAGLTKASILFVGAHSVASPISPWNVSCVAKLSNLRLITSVPWDGSMAAAFAIVK
jgi:hypothetical protein